MLPRFFSPGGSGGAQRTPLPRRVPQRPDFGLFGVPRVEKLGINACFC